MVTDGITGGKMKKSIDRNSFLEILHNGLDTRSGKNMPVLESGGDYWEKVLDIQWKSGIHFVVWMCQFRRGHFDYAVMRDGQQISHIYHASRSDEAVLRAMQHIIDDIENGKFRNKKTKSEKIKAVIEERGLVSYMNNTKWNELFSALREDFPDNSIRYKTLFDGSEPIEFWDIRSDEELSFLKSAEIEWLKIRYMRRESERTGALLPEKISVYNDREEIMRLFEKYSIPYEENKAEQTFIVYGYK